jgi:hypothetical protein
VLLWAMNGADLALTLRFAGSPDFAEVNPMVKPLMPNLAAVAAWKVGAVLAGTAVFLVWRRRRLTEFCAWSLCAAYAILTLYWLLAAWHLAYAPSGTWRGGCADWRRSPALSAE